MDPRLREDDGQSQALQISCHSREGGNPCRGDPVSKQPAVYILASGRNGTLYTGVTSNLAGRTWQHREHVVDGFTKRHDVRNLVWYELHPTMESAIVREKRIKKWNRNWKLRLIQPGNPHWIDLWPLICGESVAMDPRLRGDDEQKHES